MIGPDAHPGARFDVIAPELAAIADDRARQEAWQDALSPVMRSEPDKDIRFPRDIGFRGHHLGRYVQIGLKASPQTVTRTRAQIAAQAVDHIALRLHLSGESALLDPEPGAVVRPGSFMLVDLSQPFRWSWRGVSAILLCIPRRHFEARLGDLADRHCEILPTAPSPPLRLLSAHLRRMQPCLAVMDAEQVNLLAGATLALCNAALASAGDQGRSAPAVAGLAMRQFIEENLGRAELGVDLLRARFGLSRSPLYAMFEAEGGVATYIRNRRLARAMRVLSGIEGAPRPRISALAYACGYDSEKMFSRAFRRRYGVNPRDVGRSFGTQALQETGALLLEWIKEL